LPPEGVILETRNLSRVIRDGVQEKTVIDGFSFAFRARSIYTIIGPSGAGKSSLLRLLNRLDEPTSGEILFHDKNIKTYLPCELRRKVGYLFQTPYLFPETVRDNLLFANETLHTNDLERLMKLVQIAPSWLERSVATLSVGEKQRVALARLLATNPEVVLLDEPTSALDPSHTVAIEHLIKDIVSRMNLTVVMVTHNPEQALRMGGETILLVNGRLAETGPCEKVITDPDTEPGRLYKMRQLR
jgi:putative ABC transport system ATP-binding protein